jgi:hypothetical protein
MVNLLNLQGALRNGAGIEIGVAGYSLLDLQGLAGAAAKGGGMLTLRDAEKLGPLDTLGLSGTGGRSVTFKF